MTHACQVLYGKLPYWGTPNYAIAVRVLEGHRPQKPKGAESLGLTDELWAMAEQCWQEKRDQRPEVGEILHCLESAAQVWDTRPPPPHQAMGNGHSHDEDLSSTSSTSLSEGFFS